MPAPDKQLQQTAYKRTMTDMRQSLSRFEAVCSAILHAPLVEQVLSLAEHIVLRPRALLIGAICASITLTGSYLLNKLYGFDLSGAVTLAGLCIGWSTGLIYDGISALIQRR